MVGVCGYFLSSLLCPLVLSEHRLTPPPPPLAFCWVSNLLKYFLKYILCKLTWWCQLWLGRADRWEVAVHHWGAACWGPDTTGTDSEHTASYKLTDMFPIREGEGGQTGIRVKIQISEKQLCATTKLQSFVCTSISTTCLSFIHLQKQSLKNLK